jgi:hypothetical protein
MPVCCDMTDPPPSHDGLEGLLTFFLAWANVFLYILLLCFQQGR